MKHCQIGNDDREALRLTCGVVNAKLDEVMNAEGGGGNKKRAEVRGQAGGARAHP